MAPEAPEPGKYWEGPYQKRHWRVVLDQTAPPYTQGCLYPNASADDLYHNFPGLLRFVHLEIVGKKYHYRDIAAKNNRFMMDANDANATRNVVKLAVRQHARESMTAAEAKEVVEHFLEDRWLDQREDPDDPAYDNVRQNYLDSETASFELPFVHPPGPFNPKPVETEGVAAKIQAEQKAKKASLLTASGTLDQTAAASGRTRAQILRREAQKAMAKFPGKAKTVAKSARKAAAGAALVFAPDPHHGQDEEEVIADLDDEIIDNDDGEMGLGQVIEDTTIASADDPGTGDAAGLNVGPGLALAAVQLEEEDPPRFESYHEEPEVDESYFLNEPLQGEKPSTCSAWVRSAIGGLPHPTKASYVTPDDNHNFQLVNA